jgi:alkylated DNA repair dioxygenase AlkB
LEAQASRAAERSRQPAISPERDPVSTHNHQADLFETSRESPRELPEGMRYARELITPDEEQRLVQEMAALPFKEFEFHGFLGKRRTVSFGWQYDFNGGGLKQAGDMPEFLLPVRAVAARLAGLDPSALEHALLIEYGPGAAIGWHRDRPQFGDVIGISLLSPCTFRLRRKAEHDLEKWTPVFGKKSRSKDNLVREDDSKKRHPARSTWERRSIDAEPRSAYLLRGPSRTEWEHSIPPLETLRYSITFRTLLPRPTPRSRGGSIV